MYLSVYWVPSAKPKSLKSSIQVFSKLESTFPMPSKGAQGELAQYSPVFTEW